MKPLRIGKKTQWGKITCVGFQQGERWYMMVSGNVVTLMPGKVVEDAERSGKPVRRESR